MLNGCNDSDIQRIYYIFVISIVHLFFDFLSETALAIYLLMKK